MLFIGIFFYLNILNSNLNLEINNSVLSNSYFKNQHEEVLVELNQLQLSTADGYKLFLNPKEQESALRVQFVLNQLGSAIDLNEIKETYLQLLYKKPTWPYFYSGLVQVSQVAKNQDFTNIAESIMFGPHETKIIKSMAEVAFYRWQDISNEQKQVLLDYLSGQSIHNITSSSRIAAKFGRIKSFCEYLFEKFKQENSVCLQNYWKPLINE
jgi:hypothetical protein